MKSRKVEVMAQAQLQGLPSIELADVWHLSDEEEAREKPLSGSSMDIFNVRQRTKAAVSELFYNTTAADGVCAAESCSFVSRNRRKLFEHCESHYLIYVANCGYLAGKRDSVAKHIRNTHDRQGRITQWDLYSWPEFIKQYPDMPDSAPTLPLKFQTFGNRCNTMLRMDLVKDSAQPAKPLIEVRRIEHPTPAAQADDVVHPDRPSTVEPSPMVIVEPRHTLERRLATNKQNLKHLLQVAEDIREDITRITGQLAKLDK